MCHVGTNSRHDFRHVRLASYLSEFLINVIKWKNHSISNSSYLAIYVVFLSAFFVSRFFLSCFSLASQFYLASGHQKNGMPNYRLRFPAAVMWGKRSRLEF